MTGTAWPAIPYSALNGNPTDEDRPPSPPKFAFNGVSTEPPKSFRQSARSDAISDETLARQRALEEEQGLYPPLTVPNMLGGSRNADSPVIPLSPDPFGRYPSEAEATRLQDERNSQSFGDDVIPQRQFLVPNLPDRSSSLTIPNPNESRPPSQTPSSRFSMDSLSSDEVAKAAIAQQQNKTSSIMGMKSIRKLWRKSDSKRGSVSTQVQQLESGRASPSSTGPLPPIPNGQPQSPQPTGRSFCSPLPCHQSLQPMQKLLTVTA